jgi:Concanavalin A-like lectin/glucanases superfamily
MAGDPNYSARVLGLHFNGANNSTTITDNSPSPKTPTVNGNAKITTVATDAFGGNAGALALDGAGDYLQYGNNAAFAIGNGDFTINGWVWFNNLTATQTLISLAEPNSSIETTRGFGVTYFASPNNFIQGFIYSGVTLYHINSSTLVIAANAWRHIELTRVNGELYFFIGGVLAGSLPAAAVANFTANMVLRVGRYIDTAPRELNGLIDDLVFAKAPGHTANFTPPAVPFFNQQSQIIGTITESLAASKFIARAYDMDTGAEVGNTTTTTNAFTVDIKTAAQACEVKVSPDYKIWKPNTLYAVGDNVFPRDPIAKPYYFTRLAAGNSGASEPVWPVSPPGAQVNDGAQNNAWELVERLIQPVTHGPLIPS